MSVLRQLLLWALVAGLMLFLLVCFLPASWAVAWYGDRLPAVQLRQLSGTLWRGQAGQVLDRGGRDLGGLHWQLSPALLLGHPELHLEFSGHGLSASGALQRESGQRWLIDRAQVRATPQALAQLLGQPAGPWAGQLYLDIGHAVVWNGWPMALEAQLGWRDAAVQTAGWLPLGNLMLRARSQQGVLSAELEDDGSGPLQVHGQGHLDPLGWSLQAEAVSRHENPALSAWLAGFGPPDSHGMVHLVRSGGLLDFLH